MKSFFIFSPISLFVSSPHCTLAVKVRICKREIKLDIPASALRDMGSTSA